MDTLLKSTTRHVRLFTARVEGGDLVPDASQLTLDLDPDEESDRSWRDVYASSFKPVSSVTTRIVGY